MTGTRREHGFLQGQEESLMVDTIELVTMIGRVIIERQGIPNIILKIPGNNTP